MHTQKNATFARKATALLGAIAASGLLGLPALAGGAANTGNNPGKQVQTAPSNDQTQCAPAAQSSLPSNTATPDAAAPAAAQLPNQADPRAGLSPSDQSISDQSPSNQTTSNQTIDNRSGVSAVGGSTTQTIEPTANSANARNDASIYGDVLAQGGVTAGGFASQKVAASNNPAANRNASSRYSSNQARMSDRDGSTMTGTTSAVMSEPTRTDGMSQSSIQSSRITNGTTIAQCPTGTMPGSSTPEIRQAPDQPAGTQASPQPANPQMRQSPADDNGSRAR